MTKPGKIKKIWPYECWHSENQNVEEKSSKFFKRIVPKLGKLPGGVNKDHLHYFAKPDAQALIFN